MSTYVLKVLNKALTEDTVAMYVCTGRCSCYVCVYRKTQLLCMCVQEDSVAMYVYTGRFSCYVYMYRNLCVYRKTQLLCMCV